ncbi:MAG TPA: zf-HC2 domain-containing protein [Pyrinomonadaceae bacterium]|nr:zf-HC2 domain-containing protein [Pyrinomonadaceae bacterium]
MEDTRERPVCHRAEDLVSYLYGEAGGTDALDFHQHLEQCDACRSEYAVFNQVHASIQLWRNEALGAAFDQVAMPEPATEARQLVRPERKLSALAAVRQFFSVSPLWLRGATAFAALLLCVLSVMMVARVRTRPVQIANNSGPERLYTQHELQDHVNKAVEQVRNDLLAQQTGVNQTGVKQNETKPGSKSVQVATNQRKELRPRGLNRQEREQLAADLRLTSTADEDDLLLAFPEQDKPRQ